MIVVHHDRIRQTIKPAYCVADVDDLLALLQGSATLTLTPLATGLFPAASLDSRTAAVSGYGYVWVRDNIFVAWAQATNGKWDDACGVLRALAAYFTRYRCRFEAIVEGRVDRRLPANRPQVRFDGVHLAEIPTPWAHAQNDALGYFLWLYCRFANSRRLAPDIELVSLFALFFEAIRYWEDEDSGHWEERRKVEASSIGVVVAALRELRTLVLSRTDLVWRFGDGSLTATLLDRLIAEGVAALNAILPSECIQPDPRKQRRYDAALLFLITPLDVVDAPMAQRIVDDVVEHLEGDYGIRRYLGDSYWAADFKEKLPVEERALDVSERQEERDVFAVPGFEAQWCIFDPIVSVIAGRRYLRSGAVADLERQVRHLNRSLGQLTGPDCIQGELRCPEAYYVEHGRYVPNDNVPLLWTQANLWVALRLMRESAARTPERRPER
jgi:phosphorylase kinase alpha/beta subunit